MAYQSLYRKYRPQTFADVVGQEHVVRTLQNAITSERIAHGYLFTGTRGTARPLWRAFWQKRSTVCRGIMDQYQSPATRVMPVKRSRRGAALM